MSDDPCEGCQEECVGYQECTECGGTGFFAGAGIVSIHQPHYYNMSQPSKLPCRICNGDGVVANYCPYYSIENGRSE